MRLKTKGRQWERLEASLVSWDNSGAFGLPFSCRVLYKYSVTERNNEDKANFYYGSRINIWSTGVSPAHCHDLKKLQGKRKEKLQGQRKEKDKEEEKLYIYYNSDFPVESIIDRQLDSFFYSLLVFLHVGFLSRLLVYWLGQPPEARVSKDVLVYVLSTGIQFLSVFWVILNNYQGDPREAITLAALFCVLGIYWISWHAKNAHEVINENLPLLRFVF